MQSIENLLSITLNGGHLDVYSHSQLLKTEDKALVWRSTQEKRALMGSIITTGENGACLNSPSS